MVLTLVIPLRLLLGLEDIVTPRHIDILCKATLAAGLMVAYAYGAEYFTAWHSGNPEERFAYFANRLADPYVFGPLLHVEPAPCWGAFWGMIACNVVVPQLLWFRKIRSNLLAVCLVAILINVGMWSERFVIIVSSLQRDFLTSSWGGYAPTVVDVLLFVGTFGLFLTLLLLFMRFVPIVAIAEVKGVAQRAAPAAEEEAAGRVPCEKQKPVLRWLMAEFGHPSQAARAVAALRNAGLSGWNVYAPYPAPEISRAMGLKESREGWAAFVGGAMGFAAGMLMIWWMNAVNEPLLIGGKPAFSPWTALPVAFELTALFGALGAFFGMLRANGLPRFHNPLFNAPRFALASRDRFLLVIDMAEPACAERNLCEVMASHGSRRIEYFGD
jgi:hypothetical protein